ncbi:MAG: class I SAM-dependent methyltransferase [Crocinitomicaceae bacterium]|tara:strand:- start:49640 stop:50374 length:735 start_codon:yes stop_codon:yes gene_type:complete
MQKKEWFAEWFDTSYYHILYQNRNDEEAKRFIQALLGVLKLTPNSSLLDLACGKGRHAVTLNSSGHRVLGVDLSAQSIAAAKGFENSNLSFAVHDMRKAIQGETFDCVFNLFTSFGYFDSHEENERVCEAIYKMLKPGGQLVIDFMNATKVINNIVEKEQKSLNGIDFNISRKYTGTHILKEIRFVDKGEHYHFTERVQTIDREQFVKLLAPYFNIKFTFGSFDLDEYIPEKSERLIIIASRKL